ncbi:MAG: helicase-related protein [Deltaproteobacteria bacterium]|nr:helicase-related protein [Deltaproteobacteria bacterium]MCX7953194.1 helicase-related protein [Deltaproteobacteria bacterium]
MNDIDKWALSVIFEFSTKKNQDRIFILAGSTELFLLKACFNELGEKNVYSFPNFYSTPIDAKEPSEEVVVERLKFLNALGGEGIFIIEPASLLFKIIDPTIIQKSVIRLKQNNEIDPEKLIEKLKRIWFKESLICYEKQTFCFKGKILDIAPAELPYGIRVEIKDGSIERIDGFDLATQRRVTTFNEICVLPQKEFDFSWANDESLQANIGHLPPEVYFKCKGSLEKKQYWPGLETLNTLLMPTTELSSFISQIFFTTSGKNEYLRLKKNYEGKNSNLTPLLSSYLEHIRFRKLPCINLQELKLAKKTEEIIKAIKVKRSFLDYKVVVFSDSRYDLEFCVNSLESSIGEKVIASDSLSSCLSVVQGSVFLVQGGCPKAYEDPDRKILLINIDHIIRKIKTSQVRARFDIDLILDQLSGFNTGDYVVHKDHGICIFDGLILKSIGEVPTELIKLIFADSTLFIPVEKIFALQKYASFNINVPPKLDYLSRTHLWKAKKKQAQELAGELASALIKNFAVRKLPRGFVYPAKNDLDELFAADFEHIQTIDQEKAVEDIFRDLTGDKLMDRLICGDTGFGKTEVALRACFKVLSFGKQVAVLCPTNLLCEQNYNVFKSRLEKFGFKVIKLNRFVAPRERKESIELFNSEKAQCLVTTTALFSPLIHPKNLGLLIIDEEHKFGVTHKERHYNLPVNIDKLYLSATPLPRTLNLVLTELRSMSLILTPPSNRKKHYVAVDQFDWRIVENAVRREFERGGQVFFVVSKISSFVNYEKKLEQLVGKENLEIAHGRMKSVELENAFRRFLNGKKKLLLSTTIIEAGLDITNVNTIIVADSENFGLSQLYQLKGRVGRGNAQGFVYFLFSSASISEYARKRIEALCDFIEIGQSFQLAVRDMEMRGVGTFLGKAQKGKVDLIGYEGFLDLVKEAIHELRGGPKRLHFGFDPEVVTPWPSFIPEDYVRGSFTRLSLYRKITMLKHPEEFAKMKEYLEDAFGTLPPPALNFLNLAEIKLYLRIGGIIKATVKKDYLQFNICSAQLINEKILNDIQAIGWHLRLSDLTITINESLVSFEDLKIYVIKWLQVLAGDEKIIYTFFADA